MGDYVKKKGFVMGFNLISVSAIFLGGNLNKKRFSFAMEIVKITFHFGYIVFFDFIATGFIGRLMPQKPQIMQERTTI